MFHLNTGVYELFRYIMSVLLPCRDQFKTLFQPTCHEMPMLHAAFDDAMTYCNVRYFQKIMPIYQAYKEAVKQVEKGLGYRGRKRHLAEQDKAHDMSIWNRRSPCIINKGPIRSIPCIILQTFGVRTRKRASTKALLDKYSSREQVE